MAEAMYSCTRIADSRCIVGTDAANGALAANREGAGDSSDEERGQGGPSQAEAEEDDDEERIEEEGQRHPGVLEDGECERCNWKQMRPMFEGEERVSKASAKDCNTGRGGDACSQSVGGYPLQELDTWRSGVPEG